MRKKGCSGWKPPIGVLLVAVLVVAIGIGATVQSSAAAAATSAAPQRAPAAVSFREIAKNVLRETSIDGPAFSSLSDYVPVQTRTFPVSALAWTGTDAHHSLNVMISTSGLVYEDKLTLHENSATRPAVLLVHQNNANRVVLAWTGTDAHHSLNVLYDVYGARTKITIGDNSLFSPALAFFNGQIWLAWTGTDVNRSLNVRAMGPQGLTPGPKTILSMQGVSFSSRNGPSLRADMRDHLLLLTWLLLPLPPTIDLAQSSDGVRWTTSFSPPPPQTSVAQPDVMVLPADSHTTGIPADYWAWTGTDSARSLNLASTSTLNNWPAPVVTLKEQGLGGPELGYVDAFFNGGGHQIVLAWTGVDPQHHLNVAILSVE